MKGINFIEPLFHKVCCKLLLGRSKSNLFVWVYDFRLPPPPIKKKLYISVPISGRDIETAKLEAEVWKSVFANDYEVVTPFEINVEQAGKRYSQLMGKDIEVLLECDAIFMCPGWMQSKGCNAEYQIARIYDMEIIE